MTGWTEEERLRVLAAHRPREGVWSDQLDELTRLAADLCETPICVVSLVGADTQDFIARTGIEASGTARAPSFCQHAMTGSATMVVPDASLDPRFADNPLVLGEPKIRFYAGAPIRSTEGAPLGALCVIDRAPRAGLSERQLRALTTLARQVSLILDAGRQADDSDSRFRILADTMPQMVWSTKADGFHDYYNARWYEFTGVPDGSTDGEGWNGMFHPEDQDRAWARWRRSLETGEPYEIEYRLRRADGEYRWTLGRALPMRDADGRIVRWFGTCTDIHDQQLLLEERQLVSQELSHRIKNIFAIVAGMVSLSARRHPEAKGVAADLRDRIIALGQAHDFVRPHSPRSGPTAKDATLQGLLNELFEAYHADGTPRIRITGPDLEIDDRSTTPLALMFHELATNSAKYGALSAPDGHVDLAIETVADECVFRWRERGGPPVMAPTEGGFGTHLIEVSAVRQLGARIEREWPPGGLVFVAHAPRAAFTRPGRRS